DVRHARTGQLKRELDEAVQHANARNPTLEREKIRHEQPTGFGIEQARDELRGGILVVLAGICPGRRKLGFARSLHDVSLDPGRELRERRRREWRLGQLDGPGTKQGLIEQILVVSAGRAPLVQIDLPTAIESGPPAYTA